MNGQRVGWSRSIVRTQQVILGFALVAGTACGGDDARSSDAPGPAAPLVCEPGSGEVAGRCAPAGFEACEGGTCGTANTACPRGTVAFLGQTECTPVGPGECAPGFT